MEFQILKFETHTLIKVLVERLDTSIAPILKNELVLINGNGQKNIILDICNCKYCDAAGLSAVLAGNRLCHNSGGIFVLIGLNGSFKRLINKAHLDTILSIASSIQDAESLIKVDKPIDLKNENSVNHLKTDFFLN
jgi:anti-anti-sigma factor